MEYVPSLDFISSIFNLDSIDQDLFEFEFSDPNPNVTSKIISFQNSNIDSPIIGEDPKNGKKRKVCEASEVREIEKGDEWKNKRMKHREVERLRRQEVASLFKNLRSLLPLQYIKGKRSSSDHVLQAVSYIKDLQKKIKELEEKKDKINNSWNIENKISKSKSSSTEERSISSSSSSNCTCSEDKDMNVVIMQCIGGIEIMISCCLRHKFDLSNVIQVLIQEEGFNVVRCSSTTLQSRLLHNIHTQVDHERNINFAELQKKIMKTRNGFTLPE